jgi:hypothetical protein
MLPQLGSGRPNSRLIRRNYAPPGAHPQAGRVNVCSSVKQLFFMGSSLGCGTLPSIYDRS